MSTRTGFASCAVLVLLAVANVAAAQQSRERRQERRTEPSQPEPTITTLSEQTFEQIDGLYWVRHISTESGAETCQIDRKSTRLNSSHANISYAVFCLKKKN